MVPMPQVNTITFGTRSKAPLPRNAHSSPPPSNNPLFEGLVCETHQAALMTAVTASCINAAAAGHHPLERETLSHFLPVEPSVLLSLTRRSLLEVELLTETRTVVESFFQSLSLLRRMLSAFEYDAAEIGRGRAEVLHARRLSAAACACCHEAFLAVRALENETPGRLLDLYADHAADLGRILLSAERGGSPCIGESGEPFVPSLPQRRRSMRRALAQNCRVIVRGAVRQAVAKDVSETGLGLLRVAYLLHDDVITVELMSGRRFRGVVVWCRGEAAGVRFEQPIPPGDPMLMV